MAIRENIVFGSIEHASPERVSEAIQIAILEPDLDVLPEGLGTQIGEGVMRVSGGQRQLLSLARALVWDPAVLLFDEATSAIDSASEAAFRQSLQAEAGRRQQAILTVAHRLSTALEADCVIVLDHGKIIEMNAPEALIRQGGRFAALLEMEGAGWDWRKHANSVTMESTNLS